MPNCKRALASRFGRGVVRTGHLGTRTREHTRVRARRGGLRCRGERRSGGGAAGAHLAVGPRGRLSACVETLELFAGVLGAEAGNLGLRSTATGGVFLGGGIPPKILPALRTGAFLDAFRDKAPMSRLVAAMPVAVILEPDAALLGAAAAAAGLLADDNAA